VTKLVLAEEFVKKTAEDCYEGCVRCIFEAIVDRFSGHTTDEHRDAFLGLLQRWLDEGRICLFPPDVLRRPDGTFNTKVRKVPGYWEGYWDLWDVSHDEMIAWMRKHWPDGTANLDEIGYHIEMTQYLDRDQCPRIGWYNPETGEIDTDTWNRVRRMRAMLRERAMHRRKDDETSDRRDRVFPGRVTTTKLILSDKFIEELTDPKKEYYGDIDVRPIFDMIVDRYPGHTMDEYRDAFLGLLQRWLEEKRIIMFAPSVLMNPDWTYETKVRTVPGCWEIWDIPNGEMIAWIQDYWPITERHDDDFRDFFLEVCPYIGWINPETGAIDASP